MKDELLTCALPASILSNVVEARRHAAQADATVRTFASADRQRFA